MSPLNVVKFLLFIILEVFAVFARFKKKNHDQL